MPLEQVLGEIRAGAVVSKMDYGFMLVDVAPDSRVLAPPPARKDLSPPMTFIAADAVEDGDAAALPLETKPELRSDNVSAVEAVLPVAPMTATEHSEPVVQIAPAMEPAAVDDESEDGPDPNFGEPDDGKPLNWRAARTRASAMRRRPPTRFS